MIKQIRIGSSVFDCDPVVHSSYDSSVYIRLSLWERLKLLFIGNICYSELYESVAEQAERSVQLTSDGYNTIKLDDKFTMLAGNKPYDVQEHMVKTFVSHEDIISYLCSKEYHQWFYKQRISNYVCIGYVKDKLTLKIGTVSKDSVRKNGVTADA